MKELEEINEKKTKEILEKLEDTLISREEMYKMKERASKLNKVSGKGKIYSSSEKLKHRIEEMKVPTLESLKED